MTKRLLFPVYPEAWFRLARTKARREGTSAS